MSYQTHRFLIVFNSYNHDEKALNKKIQRYRMMIEKTRSLSNLKIEYFLLYVTPQLPGYALQTPEMLQFAAEDVEQAEKMLNEIGSKLNIKVENQFFSEGNSDLQAWHLAKELEIDKVFGYTKTFQHFLKIVRSIKQVWKHITTTEKPAVKQAN